MKRTSPTSIMLGLILLIALATSVGAGAHPVAVDGNISDWFATTPLTSPGAYPNPNTAQVARNPQQQGEFIWRDAVHDQRISATTTITKDVDLRTFRVTGDATNLYLSLNVESVVAQSGGKVVEFQIGVDTTIGAGSTELVDGPGSTGLISTTVAGDAAWEYLIQTQFKNSLTAAPRVYSAPGGVPSTTGTSGQLKSQGVDTAELKVPWSALGGMPAAGKSLRFTVATLYSDRSNSSAPLANGSKVMDTMHPTQTAGEDLEDGALSFYVEVFFDAKGEVFSPLLITEFLINPLGPDDTSAQNTEWIEIANVSAFPVQLGDYKIGDAARRIPGEAMFDFPVKTLNAGAVVIVANNKTRFNQNYPGIAGSPNVTVYSVGELTSYGSWSSGAGILTLLDGPSAVATSFTEEVVLLDGRDTIVDLANYISSVLPNSPAQQGHVPIVVQGSLVPVERSYERCPPSRDTNDNTFDFIPHDGRPAQTPGVVCAGKTALKLVKSATTTVTVGGRIDYVLTYSNSGASVTNVFITDTLPANLTYVADSQVANPVFGTSPIVFTNLGGGTLQWKLPLVGTGSGTISFSAQVDNSAALVGQSRTNSAVINSSMPDTDAADNTSTATTSLTAVPQANLGIAKALTSPPESFYNGTQAVYTLTYSNTGDLPAEHTRITDTISSGLTFVSASQAPAMADSGMVVFDVGTVAGPADATIVLTFTLSAPKAGGTTIVNNAEISTTSTELVTADNAAAASTQTIAEPPLDLALTKTASVAEVRMGGEISYQFTLDNLSVMPASDIQVVDTLPAGLTYKPGSTTDGAGEPAISTDGRTLTWTLPANLVLDGGARTSFGFVAVASSVDPGDALVNNAVVHVAGDPTAENNAAASGATVVTGTRVLLPLVLR